MIGGMFSKTLLLLFIACVGTSTLVQPAQPAAPQTAPAAATREPPRLVATWFPWYAWPDRHLGVGDRPLPLRHHPLAPQLADPEAPDWHVRELDDAAAAGIDALLLANVPSPTRLDAVLHALAQALERRADAGRPLVQVGLLLDPWFTSVERSGGEGGGTPQPLDLRDQGTRQAFLAPLDAYFAEIAAPFRARLDGRPLVVVGGDGAIGACPPDFFDALEQEAPARFGEAPLFVLEQSWDDRARRAWKRGAALFGAQRKGDVATLGPGFLDEASARGLVRPPASRAAFLADARALLAAPPALTIIESWNQFHDGSAVAPTLEHGTRYIAALREWKRALADQERASHWPQCAPTLPLLGATWHPDRDVALANAVSWLGDGDGRGLRLIEVSPPEAAAAAQFDFEQETLRLGVAGGRMTFDLSPVFCSDAAADFVLRVDASGAAPLQAIAGGHEVACEIDSAGARTARFTALVTRTNPRIELRATGPLELRRVLFERTTDRFPTGGLGIDDPDLFRTALHGGESGLAKAGARITAAATLGARWLRCELDWESFESCESSNSGGAGEAGGDFAAVAAVIAAIRMAEIEPIVAVTSPPPRARPIGAHAEVVADFVSELRRTAGPNLRVIELLPESSEPQRYARQPDLPGDVRMLRAVAKRLRVEAPELALVLGSVRGPDANWFDTFHALREPWHTDAAALRLDDAFGALGTLTHAKALARTLEAAAGPRRWPRFVTLAPAVRPPTMAVASDDAAIAAIAATVRIGLEHAGHADDAIHLLDAGELPCVGGFATERARAALAASGNPVIVAKLIEFVRALTDGSARVAAVASGEWWPGELIAALPGFVDRGGLLITLGGPPAQHSATVADDGGFDAAGRDAGLALTDDLRIGIAAWNRALDPLADNVRVVPGLTVPSLALPLERPRLAALFERRTGEPRDPRGYHRYETLASAELASGAKIGDVAALLQYQGGREGALLLIGVDGGAGIRGPEAQASALREGLARIAELPEAAGTIVLWRGLFDRADDTDRAEGLLTVDGQRKPAADVFERAARARMESR